MTRKDYVSLRLQKATESLRAASLMLDEGLYSSAINRVYYAVFYSVSALVYTKRLYPKSHTRMNTLFNKEFVLTG